MSKWDPKSESLKVEMQKNAHNSSRDVNFNDRIFVFFLVEADLWDGRGRRWGGEAGGGGGRMSVQGHLRNLDHQQYNRHLGWGGVLWKQICGMGGIRCTLDIIRVWKSAGGTLHLEQFMEIVS